MSPSGPADRGAAGSPSLMQSATTASTSTQATIQATNGSTTAGHATVTKKTPRFPCSHCGLLLTTRGGVRRHEIARHTTQRPHLCPFSHCEYATKGFSRPDALTFHMRTHAGQTIPAAESSQDTREGDHQTESDEAEAEDAGGQDTNVSDYTENVAADNPADNSDVTDGKDDPERDDPEHADPEQDDPEQDDPEKDDPEENYYTVIYPEDNSHTVKMKRELADAMERYDNLILGDQGLHETLVLLESEIRDLRQRIEHSIADV